MAANKILNIPPVFVPAAAGNLFNVGSGASPVGFTGNTPYALMKHIRLVNVDASAHTVTLYKGATAGSAAGTQFAFAAISIPANSYVDWYGQHRFDTGDFLTGIADTASKVVINMDAELGIA